MKVQILILVLLVTSSFSMKLSLQHDGEYDGEWQYDGEMYRELENHQIKLSNKVEQIVDVLSGDVQQLGNQIWQVANFNGDEFLNKNEFYTAVILVMSEMNEDLPGPQEAVHIYNSLDKNGDGFLDKREFTQGFREFLLDELLNNAEEQWWTELFLGWDVVAPLPAMALVEGSTYEMDLYERSFKAFDSLDNLYQTIVNPAKSREMFESAVFWSDSDNSESLDLSEFTNLIEEICNAFDWQQPSKDELEGFFQLSDRNSNGSLDQAELELVATKALQPEIVRSYVRNTRAGQEINAEIFQLWEALYPSEFDEFEILDETMTGTMLMQKTMIKAKSLKLKK